MFTIPLPEFIVLIVSAFVFAESIPTGDWTYQDVYDYAILNEGTNDPTARLVVNHIMESQGVKWNGVYRGGITSETGGVLTVEDTPHGRLMRAREEALLSAQKNVRSGADTQHVLEDPIEGIIEGGSIRSHVYTATCQDRVTYYWTSIQIDRCVFLPGGDGHFLRFYSSELIMPDMSH